MIFIDDLNNDIGALGVDHAYTPNLDSFAAKGRLFSRHYVQVPSCGPSRAALLRGKRPSKEDYLSNQAILTTYNEWGYQSLPEWFRAHGYKTLSLGKVSHYPGGLAGDRWTEEPEEMPGAWNRAWIPEGSPWKTPEDMMHGYANGLPRERGESPAWEAYDGPDTVYPDAWVADDAIKTLHNLEEQDNPWFFAVGFFKPHLPFAAPKRWFDIHGSDEITVPEDTVRYSNPSSWHSSGELMNNYGQHPSHPQKDKEYAQQLRLAYAAATSYMDAQLGRVLKTFYQLDMADNTIVIIWSDHGFALGHQGIWGKHSLYEYSLKSPVLIWYPGIKHPGEISDAIIESIDIYPTLIDLASLPTPQGLQGKSLRPQLENPNTKSIKPAFSFFNAGQNSVRVEDWRLIIHREAEEILGYELFDFNNNPNGERQDPDDHPAVIDKLSKHLKSLPWISN